METYIYYALVRMEPQEAAAGAWIRVDPPGLESVNPDPAPSPGRPSCGSVAKGLVIASSP